MSVIKDKNDLENYLMSRGINEFHLVPLKQEASQRDYFRIELPSGNSGSKFLLKLNLNKDDNKNQAFVISVNHHELEKEDDFFVIQSHLKNAGIPVPDIYKIDYEEGLIWQEDLGSDDLNNSILNDGPELSGRTEDYYFQCIQCLVQLKNLQPSIPYGKRFFDSQKLSDELDFLKVNSEKYIKNTDINIGREVLNEWSGLSGKLDSFKSERVCHRDFHSRNIMIKEGKVFLIDFQDARMGSRYYDLASLVFDPYAGINKKFQEELYSKYHKDSREEENRDVFEYQAIQRLLKALGTYLNQVHEKKNLKFYSFIIPTLLKLNELLKNNNFPETLKWIEKLQERFLKTGGA